MFRVSRERPLRSAASLLRPALALGVLVLCMGLLRDRFAGTDPDQIIAAVGETPAIRWAAAGALTLGSFLAIGLYDVAIHRWLGTGVTAGRAALSGAAAIAVSQLVGLGLVSGTLARWHLLPGHSLERAARVTATVAASFLAALVVAIACAGLLAGLPGQAPGWLLPAGLCLAIALIALSLAQPRRFPVRLPSLKIMGGIFVATMADTVLASLALWVLIPESAALPATALVPAFMIALAAGMVSGTPAGAGPFELTLLWLLPGVPEADLLAAILAFRLVYFGLPALLGGVAMIAFAGGGVRSAETRGAPCRNVAPPRAEAGLVGLGEVSWIDAGPGRMVAADTGQCRVALGDPAARPADRAATIAAFARNARAAGLVPALYKCGGRGAASARRLGWRAVHVADEMWLDPSAFETRTANRSRLRRKLRAAERAGVAVAAGAAHCLPFAEMAAVAAEWSEARGGERGFSMGRWSPAYVSGQRVFLARHGGRLVAFATVHASSGEWALDLMRSTSAAPDGTMHALVTAAVADAAAAGCPRFSLAALPAQRVEAPGARIPGCVAPGAGLRQFKTAFAPRREPLYLAAPGRVALLLAALDIARRIARPEPLLTPSGPPRARPVHARSSPSS